MKRLGYSRFASQGGDWGAFVTNEMAQQAPPELIGIHLNFTGTAPSDVAKALQSGQPAPAGLSAEAAGNNRLMFVFQHLPTQTMMAAHPQTLYGLADSPVALADWMTDHDITSYGHIAKLFVDGEPYGDITRDDILDNITHYWLTNTGVSDSRLSHEYKGAFINDLSISVPAALRFPWRDLPDSAELDRARLPQSHPFQRPRQRRPLSPAWEQRNCFQKRLERA